MISSRLRNKKRRAAAKSGNRSFLFSPSFPHRNAKPRQNLQYGVESSARPTNPLDSTRAIKSVKFSRNPSVFPLFRHLAQIQRPHFVILTVTKHNEPLAKSEKLCYNICRDVSSCFSTEKCPQVNKSITQTRASGYRAGRAIYNSKGEYLPWPN